MDVNVWTEISGYDVETGRQTTIANVDETISEFVKTLGPEWGDDIARRLRYLVLADPKDDQGISMRSFNRELPRLCRLLSNANPNTLIVSREWIDWGGFEVERGATADFGDSVEICYYLGGEAYKVCDPTPEAMVFEPLDLGVFAVRSHLGLPKKGRRPTTPPAKTYYAYAKDRIEGLRSFDPTKLDPNCTYKYVPVLALAAARDDTAAIEFLLERGADIDGTTEEFDRTPLHIAVILKREDVTRLLLKRGADPCLVEGLEDKNAPQLADEYAPEFLHLFPEGSCQDDD